MKLKTVYVCQQCQYENLKWTGKCPSCNSWNSFVEDVVNVGKPAISPTPRKIAISKLGGDLESEKDSVKTLSGIKEFDRVVGDGILDGGLILLSGEPGIGKSTLTLQVAGKISEKKKTLIISGEESVHQISSRARRLRIKGDNLSILNEFNLETAIEAIRLEKPKFVIIDSIQVIASEFLPGSSGTVSQVRYCTEKLMEFGKKNNVPIMLIGHVTKDGNLAGPKVLEHLVDTVIQLEGDRFQHFRILRASKNRFGSCSEVGIFEMTETGLVEVKNPSEQFLEGRKKNAIGSNITVAIEGTRPFLVEVQALVSTSPFGYPKRTANGFDINRLQILIAVLEKYAKLDLQNQDVFVNVVGGIKLKEPAADLAVIMAISSSFIKKPLSPESVVFGEVGLTGELRKISHADKRKKEAQALGFTDIISSDHFTEINQVLKKLG